MSGSPDLPTPSARTDTPVPDHCHHLPRLLARTAGEDGSGWWPTFCPCEFAAYLRCGMLDHDLLLVRCEWCGDTTVGFS